MPDTPVDKKRKTGRREQRGTLYQRLLRSRKYKLVFTESDALVKSGRRRTKSGEVKLVSNVEPSIQRRLIKVDNLESDYHVINKKYKVKVDGRTRTVKLYKRVLPELSIMGWRVPANLFQSRRPDSVKHISIPKGEARTITYGLELPKLRSTPLQRQVTGLDKVEYFTYGANEIPAEDKELVDFLGEALSWLLKKYPNTVLMNMTVYYRPYDEMGRPMLVDGLDVVPISGRLKRDPVDAIMEVLDKLGKTIGENMGVSGMSGGLVRVSFNLVERLRESQSLNVAIDASYTGTEKYEMEQLK